MNITFQKILLTLVYTGSLFLSFCADGWFVILFGLFFLLTFILQLVITWKRPYIHFRKQVLIIASLFIAMCLFREDFGDSDRSSVNAITYIMYKLEFRKSEYYSGHTIIGVALNLLWLVIVVLQIRLLGRMKKFK